MSRRRFSIAKPLSVLALLLLVGGLVVEIHIRGKEAQARASLGGALGTATLPNTAGEQVREMIVEARTLAGRGDHAAAAELLDRIATQAPNFLFHDLAARAYRAAGQGDAATRHALLAARLAPTDDVLRARAEIALDLALMDSLRPWARGGVFLSLVFFAVLFGVAAGRRTREKATREYVEQVSGRIQLSIDGQRCADHAVLTTFDRGVTIDIFLSGRHGLARPAAPAVAPSLRLTCSNPSANRTLRLTPRADVRGDAIRIEVKESTVEELRAHPGTWRVQATLGERRVAVAELVVPEPMHAVGAQPRALRA